MTPQLRLPTSRTRLQQKPADRDETRGSAFVRDTTVIMMQLLFFIETTTIELGNGGPPNISKAPYGLILEKFRTQNQGQPTKYR